MNDYAKLKSGTDIRGRAIDGDLPAVLTEHVVKSFACAFALWLTKRTGKSRCKIVIGRDSRLTGENFAKAIISALRTAGQEIYDCGMFSTPAAFLVTKFPSVMADGSIMITASHHPKDINGLKFFTADGGVNSAELDEIIELANADAHIQSDTYSTVIRRDCLRLYCDMLTETIRKGTGQFLPLKGMKIAVDAGHGAGGFFATRVLAPLGADTSASQFIEPDGNFPAHAPNPENREAMESLKARVLESGADLGIIFDADVDRCAIVGHDGTEINRCALIALASAMILPEHAGATIVTDSVTTENLRKFIEAHGGVQKRFKRGYRNVIDEAKRLNDTGVDAPLAIESSGHAAFAEHYFLDDGAYFIAKILVMQAKLRRENSDITELIATYEPPKEEADIRLSFACEKWRELADKILERLKGLSERLLKVFSDNFEGVRAYVSHADGYFIVRTSVHDPVLPIYIEANKKGGCLSIAKFLYSFLGGFIGLDCEPLKEYVENAEAAAEEEPEPDAEEPNDIDADEFVTDADTDVYADGDIDVDADAEEYTDTDIDADEDTDVDVDFDGSPAETTGDAE